MLPIVISPHAIDRYVERIGGTPAEAFHVLSGDAVRRASDFGARCIRLPATHRRAAGRILIRFGNDGRGMPVAVVTTVVPLTHLPAQLHPHLYGGPAPVSAVLAQIFGKAS